MFFDFKDMFRVLFWFAGIGALSVIAAALYCLYKIAVILF